MDQDKLCGRNIASGTQIRMDSEVKINFYKTIKSVAFGNSFERIAVENCLMIDQPDQFSFALHLLCILLIRWSWYLELSGAFKWLLATPGFEATLDKIILINVTSVSWRFPYMKLTKDQFTNILNLLKITVPMTRCATIHQPELSLKLQTRKLGDIKGGKMINNHSLMIYLCIYEVAIFL